MEYCIEDFTEQNYRKLIAIAKQNYNFKHYVDDINTHKTLLWRHDVDFSVHRALQLSIIEQKYGVKATYFFQLNSEFYNIFEKGIKEKMQQIISLGHSIALHFDPTAYEIFSKSDLEYYLSFEKKLLEQLFKINIRVFSFHNPTAEILRFDDYKLANMINAYAKLFKEEFYYCSDSNGYWRYDRLEHVLRNAKVDKLQILTHPGWWQQTAMKPFDRVKRCVEGRAEMTLNLYKDTLRTHGRKNVK